MNYSFNITEVTQVKKVKHVSFNINTYTYPYPYPYNGETNENKNTSNVAFAPTKNKYQSSTSSSTSTPTATIKERCVKFNEELQKMRVEQKEMETMLLNIELKNIPMSHEPHPCGNGIHAALYIKGKLNKNKAHHYR